MLPFLFSDTGATSQDGSHSAIFRMQGPEGCAAVSFENHPFGNFGLFRMILTVPWKSSLYLIGSIRYLDM